MLSSNYFDNQIWERRKKGGLKIVNKEHHEKGK